MFLGEKGWLFTFKVPVHLYRKVSWGPAVLEPSGWPNQVLLWYANFILLESALLQVSCVKIEKKKEVVNFEFGQKTKKEDETKNEEKEEKKEEERRKGRRMFSVLLHWNCNLNACIKSILYLFFFSRVLLMIIWSCSFSLVTRFCFRPPILWPPSGLCSITW